MAVGFSGALTDLGFGGAGLQNQFATETEEERKKRLQREQQMKLLSPASQALGLGAAGTGMFGGARMGIGQV